jgi:hypothetical protein
MKAFCAEKKSSGKEFSARRLAGRIAASAAAERVSAAAARAARAWRRESGGVPPATFPDSLRYPEILFIASAPEKAGRHARSVLANVTWAFAQGEAIGSQQKTLTLARQILDGALPSAAASMAFRVAVRNAAAKPAPLMTRVLLDENARWAGRGGSSWRLFAAAAKDAFPVLNPMEDGWTHGRYRTIMLALLAGTDPSPAGASDRAAACLGFAEMLGRAGEPPPSPPPSALPPYAARGAASAFADMVLGGTPVRDALGFLLAVVPYFRWEEAGTLDEALASLAGRFSRPVRSEISSGIRTGFPRGLLARTIEAFGEDG